MKRTASILLLLTACNAPSGDCTFPASQGLSQPCCVGLGIDACGAGLFCAAFDGRTHLDGMQCSEDRDCLSFGCNTEMGLCRSSPGMPCTAAVGCSTPMEKPMSCARDSITNSLVCQPRGNGSCAAVCGYDAECLGYAGLAGKCNTQAGRCECGLGEEGTIYDNCSDAGCLVGRCGSFSGGPDICVN
jgi:hypothetical protein